jgi:hypothetical protein
MNELEKKGAMTPTKLAERTREKFRQRTSMGLSHLREQKLIGASDDETDGRKKRYYITPFGELVLGFQREFMQVQPSDYKPVEQITAEYILRYMSSERTRKEAKPPVRKLIENSKVSIKELFRKPSKDTDPFRYSPMSNFDDDGLVKFVLEKNVKIDPEKCILHTTSINGINLLLDKRQDGMSTALPTMEKIIVEPENMRDLTLIGTLGPKAEVYYFQRSKASENDPINCPRRTAVRKRFAEELSQRVSSESNDDVELCTRYVKGEYSRIVSTTNSKACLHMAGMLPLLKRTYDKMFLINRSKVESGDASVKKLIKRRESIHNWFYDDEWMWRVSLDYAIAKFLSIIPKMFHGYCEDSA